MGGSGRVSAQLAPLTLSASDQADGGAGNITLAPLGSAPHGLVVVGGDTPSVAAVEGKELTLATLTEGMNIYQEPAEGGRVVVGATCRES